MYQAMTGDAIREGTKGSKSPPQNRMERVCLFRPCRQTKGVPRPREDAGQQSDPVLLHLLHPDRCRNARSVCKQRLAGKQAGRVRVRSPASLDDVKYRQFTCLNDSRIMRKLLCSPPGGTQRSPTG